MFYLIYVSTAASPLNGGDFSDVLRQSREHNAAVGITGLLLYKDGRFMQLLEGDETEVRALLAKIATDPRHHDVIVLQEGNVPQRHFSGWSMAFRHLGTSSNVVEAELAPAEIELTETALREHDSRALDLLRLFEKHI